MNQKGIGNETVRRDLVADGYRAMDERSAIKALLRPADLRHGEEAA